MSSVRALILGSGGREHALAVHLLRSKSVEHVYCAPGNGGTSVLGDRCSNVASPAASGDFSAIVQWAKEHNVNLCIPGPEAPLVAGVQNAFQQVGIPVFGPSRAAAQMEGSKEFAKEFMNRHNIPTAQFRIFTRNEVDVCMDYIKSLGAKRVVLKASGLAGGKGVLLPETDEEAAEGVNDLLVKQVFGADACDTLVVEERLDGAELSVLAFSDGYTVRALPGCQDHKRIGEGDTGLNTGGMGAYCPTPYDTPKMMAQIQARVLEPTIKGMRQDGYPFVGMLFVGLMITSEGPKVLEYNVRFGDPETEAVLDLLNPTGCLVDIMMGCVKHRLDCIEFSTLPDYAVSVVLASGGYPGKYETGKPIKIGPMPQSVTVYHAGTKTADGELLTAGGRVLVVSAVGKTLQDALDKAYAGIQQIHFDGMCYRKDIAHRALASTNKKNDGFTYAQAGVSIEAGNSLVERIKPLVRSTQRPGCIGGLGGFGAAFDMRYAGASDPILISGTDGVGTKLRIAHEYNKHDTIGIDLVAMSVNDLLVQAAQPLFFLDYFACSNLDVNMTTSVIEGISEGCYQAECALVGGETAEMPGMYSGSEYDLAGFAVGAVGRNELLPRKSNMSAGDKLLGLRSSGPHSNGYSLLRKCVEHSGLAYSSPCPWGKPDEVVNGYKTPKTLGDALLVPTTIYVKPLHYVLHNKMHNVNGLAHITGGGFTENVPRMLPDHLGARIDLRTWERQPIFRWAQKVGGIAPEEMARTFNNGIGMVLCVPADRADEVVDELNAYGESLIVIGEVTSSPGVQYDGLDTWAL